MTKLYFLGGEDIRKRVSKHINKKAFADAGGAPEVLVFPWTAKVEKREYRKIVSDYFRDIGAKKIVYAELRDPLRKIVKKINSSNLIYLPGGEPKLLIKRLREKRIVPYLRMYTGVIVGNSAGSLAQCKKYAVVKGQDGRPKTVFEQGLGFVDFAVAVHYRGPKKSLSGESPTKELRNLSKKTEMKIYTIPEKSALVYNSGNLKFIGDVYLFHKSKKTKCK